MSEITGLSRLCAMAAETLLKEYSDRKPDLFQGETATQFQFSHALGSLDWLEERLPGLAEALLPAGFTLRITVTIQDFQAGFFLRQDGGRLWVDVEHTGDYAGSEELDPLPEAAVPPLMSLQEGLGARRGSIGLDEITAQLTAISHSGANVAAELAIFLDKRAIQGRLLAGLEESIRPKLLVYLFPKSLSRALGRLSLQTLEQEYFLPSYRSVWLVFSISGCLEGEYLSICGAGSQDRLEQILLRGRLVDEVLQANLNAIQLRRRTGIWDEPPRWLTPGIFEVGPAPGGDLADWNELHAHLRRIRALLSALYLADQVETDQDCFRVSYRGLGSSSFWLGWSDINASDTRADEIYALYVYAIEGFSPDKVEITQQFLSLMADDPAGLIQKAADVHDAAQKTYQERVLVERVRDYFEARHRVQERLRDATEAASAGVINLSREVSGDVYKIASLVGAALVAALIQPDITLVAALAASTVMGLYLFLVLFYQLPTLQRASQLSQQGHKAGIRSFGDVLSVSEVEGYLEDEQLGKAQILLEQALSRAKIIYLVFFLGAVLILMIVIWISIRPAPPV